MARGRDLMRFYCPNDVTRPLFSKSVARRETMDSIYRVNWATSYFDVFNATENQYFNSVTLSAY